MCRLSLHDLHGTQQPTHKTSNGILKWLFQSIPEVLQAVMQGCNYALLLAQAGPNSAKTDLSIFRPLVLLIDLKAVLHCQSSSIRPNRLRVMSCYLSYNNRKLHYNESNSFSSNPIEPSQAVLQNVSCTQYIPGKKDVPLCFGQEH